MFPLASIRKLFAMGAAMLSLGVAALHAQPASAMTFQVINGPSECAPHGCIVASGPIDRASVGDFLDLVRQRQVPPGALVTLSSEGGVLLYGLELGEEIRRAGLSTTVEAYDPAAAAFLPTDCASACAYVFLGGVDRSVATGSRVGVHQIFPSLEARGRLTAADLQLMTSLAARHIDRMGGGAGILAAALRTPPENIYWFDRSELGRLRLVTSPVRLAMAGN